MKKLLIIFLLIGGCSETKNKNEIAKELNMDSFFEIEKNLNDDDQNDDYSPVQISDKESNINEIFYKKVTLNISQKTPIDEILITLANLIDANININSEIQKKIYIKAKEIPFIEIIENICDINNLRYKISGKTITIEHDTPYVKIYNMSFLNVLRESNSTISTKTNIFAMNDFNKKFSADGNSSTNTLKNFDKNDFWNELEKNLKSLVNGAITIHKQAGLININATEKDHKIIGEYISKLKKIVNSQVLIEAKILEVTLKNEFSSGINWSLLSKHLNINNNYQEHTSQFTSFGLNFKDLNTTIKFLEHFGSIRTLSSPRITVMNNQTAILKVARQEVYFNLIYQNNYNNITPNFMNKETIFSNINTIPVGIVLSVHPVIDIETGKIILTIKPSISKVIGTTEDPSVKLNFSKISSQKDMNNAPNSEIPIVEVREIDSVLNMNSGDVVVLGGLMQENDTKNENRHLPFKNVVTDLLAKNQHKSKELTEIIIFLKVKILNPNKNAKNQSIKKKDQEIYNNIFQDNRKINFEDKNIRKS